MSLKDLTKRDSKGFAILTEENVKIAMEIWEDWLLKAYSDNPRQLTDEECEFIEENTSMGIRNTSKVFDEINDWYWKEYNNRDSELYKNNRKADKLLTEKHYMGIKLTQEEIDFYNNTFVQPVTALNDMISKNYSRYKKGGLRNNNFHAKENDFGYLLKQPA